MDTNGAVFFYALMAVGIGALLAYAVASRRAAAASSFLAGLSPALVMVFFSLVVAGTGLAIYFEAQRALTRTVADQLESIAKLKVGQIEHWLNERFDDVRWRENPLFFSDLERWLADGRPLDARKARLLERLRQMARNGPYRDISVLSASDGAPLLRIGGHPDSAPIRAQALAAASGHEAVVEDFHFTEVGTATGIDIGLFGPVPGTGDGSALAVIHLSLDPGELLFPLIQQWPGSSPSAETLLLRREGGDLVYLNTLRHRRDTALRFRLPLSTPGLVGALAAKGKSGLAEGVDYRGVPVIAYLAAVPGTPWLLVAKVDQAEAFAQLNFLAATGAAIAATLLLIAGWWVGDQKRAEKALRQRSFELEEAQRIAHVGSVDWHMKSDRVRWSDELSRIFGLDPGQPPPRLADCPHFFTAASRARLEAALAQLRAGRGPCEIELELLRPDGEARWITVRGEARRDGAGRIVGLRGTAQDITERKKADAIQAQLVRAIRVQSQCDMALVHAEDEPALLRETCRLLVDTGGYRMAWVGFAEADAEKSVRPVAHFGAAGDCLDQARISWADNERGRGPTGTAIRSGGVQVVQNLAADPRTAPWRDAAEQHGFRASIALPLIGGQGLRGALTIYATAADAFAVEEVQLLEQLAGDLAYGIVSLRTRIEHDAAEAELAFLAHHDALTHLPNRVLLRDRFEQAAASASREALAVAMLFLDLDNFKQINDGLGHDVGDALLVRVVERLQGCVREIDTVSRHGGDEFVVLLTQIRDVSIVGRIAEKILDAFGEGFEVGGYSVSTSFSIGISLYPDDGAEFEALIKKADTAIRQAKESGRNAFRFFTAQMNFDALAQMQLQNDLRQAVKNREFLLHYQPQFEIASGRIVGAEALLRWQRPGAGLVSPASFIPAAEQSGLIVPIGAWVLAEACRQAQSWRQAGLPPLVVAVNLSALQFKRGGLLETVAEVLERSGLPPRWLELELTESILLHDTETIIATLDGLKAIGVRLSIDDFGTGYSSLSYLKRLAVDKLKIDQSFVRGLPAGAEDAAIVKAVIQMAQTLQLGVIAEGVETEAQLAFLGRQGCHEVQGYLLGRPLPAERFAEVLQAPRACRASA